MFQKSFTRILVSAILLTTLALSIATPALAFDGRGGDNVNIPAGETVNDDLYVGAQNFTLDGTVNGDVVAAGAIITINGTVEGDVIAAGQAVIINGTVRDNIRMAGGTLLIGENAKIGGDVVSAGGSLEFRQGSTIGRDLVFFGGQALLAGDITRNVETAGGAVEIRGQIGGNVNAQVGDAENAGPGPSIYMPNSPIPLPSVQPGLKIDPAAKIGGKLTYTSSKELNIPAGIVAGSISRIAPQVVTIKEPTQAEKLMTGTLDAIRRMITLILFGLLLGWLFPAFMKSTAERIRTAPLPALGWGLVSWAAFFFALLMLMVAIVIGALFFGVLTLGSISGTIVVLGLLATFLLTIGFVLAVSFVAQIIVSTLGGKLLLERVKPEWADHKVWPLVIGVVIFAALAALPVLGWLVNLVVGLLGLGTLWFFGRDLWSKKTPVVTDVMQ
jgi:cytoskeletal protein CcmA (bactofilin family)